MNIPLPNGLDILGWKIADPKLAKVLEEHDKVVLLFPHTTPLDGVLAYYYIHFDPRISKYRDRIKILVRDNNFDYPFLRPILSYIGGIPAGKPGAGSGSLNRTFEYLDSMDKFVLSLSPKGTLGKKKWQTGWYHIAKKYDATIIVAGLDYQKHQISLAGQPLKIGNRSIEEVQPILENYFREIVSLYPEMEIVESQTSGTPSLLEPTTLKAYILILLLIIIVSLLALLFCRSNKESYKYSTKTWTKYTR